MGKQPQQDSNAALLAVILIALGICLLVFVADALSRDAIEHNRRISTLRIIEDVMTLEYDNDLYQDWIHLDSFETRVYRARRNGANIGVVFMPVTSKGYNGAIKSAIGVSFDGHLTAVRIIEEHETPGLGDQVHQDKSTWVQGFRGRSLADSAPTAWAPTSENGDFDAISGATISARGVINSVRQVLEYYQLHRDKLYDE